MKPFAEALIAVQRNIKDPIKNKVGQVGQKKYKYAALDSVMDQARAALHDNGFVVSQTVEVRDGLVGLNTQLIHVSGESLQSFYPLDWTGGSQAKGSELTYARRYSLEAILGMVATDDDDGAAAQEAHKSANEVPPQGNGNTPKSYPKNVDSLIKAWFGKFDKAYPTPTQKDGLTKQEVDQAKQKNMDIQALFLKKHFGVTSIKEIPAERAARFEAWLRTNSVEDLKVMIDKVIEAAKQEML